MAADNPAYLPDLAMRAEQPRHPLQRGRAAAHDALAPTEEAVQLYRELAADNPAYLPDLASALNNLGIRYSEVGRRARRPARPPRKPSSSTASWPPTTPPTSPTSPAR